MVQVNNLITRAQELKSLGAALAERDTIITPVASQGATETVTTYTYTGYDEEGNEISLTEDQYNALVSAAGSNTNSNVTYNVIPTEVVNSGASWWINSEGQYEWVPVTESDKAHLAEVNAYRTSTGLSARTTLISGATPSEEYSERWYSTGGGNRGVGARKVKVVSSSGEVVKSYDYDTVDRAPTGSGDMKLSQLKSSSSINNSSSAKSNTAQTAKAAILSYQQAAEKYHSGEVQLADGSWIKQHEVVGNEEDTGIRIFESAAEGNAVRAAEKEAAAQRKAKAEAAAAAYIPILGIDGNAIEAIEVKRHFLESTAGIQGIISGEGYLSRASAVAKYDIQKQAAREAQKEYNKWLSGSPSWLTETASKDYIEWRSSLNLETLDLQPASLKGVTAAGITGLNSIGIGNYSDVAHAIAEAKESGKTTSTADNSLVQAAETIIETVSEKHSDLKEKVADKLSFLPTSDELENSIQETLNKTTVDEKLYSLTLIGQIDTAYDTMEKSLANNNDNLSTAIKSSIDLQQNAGKAILEGTKGFLKDEYDYAREDPLGYAEETAAIAATGYVFGAGLKLGTTAVRKGLTKVGAERATKYVEPIANGILGGSLVIIEGSNALEVYQSEGGAAAVKEVLEVGKGLSIGVIGYNKGTKLLNSAESSKIVQKAGRSLKSLAEDESAIFSGSGQRLNTDNPLRKAASQKLLYKERSLTEQKIPTYVYAHGRLYPENMVPKKTVLDITEEGAAMTGVRAKASLRASARARTQRSRHAEQEVSSISTKTAEQTTIKTEEQTKVLNEISMQPKQIPALVALPIILEKGIEKNMESQNITPITIPSQTQATIQSPAITQVPVMAAAQLNPQIIKQIQQQQQQQVSVESQINDLLAENRYRSKSSVVKASLKITEPTTGISLDLGSKQNINLLNASGKWGSRTKKHYLLDPKTFVMGRKRRRV